MTHVFIVDDNTFKYHLEYMFAGTGAREDALFLQDSNYINSRKKDDGLTSASEKNLVGMIADVSKIRVGDKVIFYLQSNRYHEGLFFGIFEVKGNPFYDSFDNNYLFNKLHKKLNFRVCLKPDIVYPIGVTEHKYLDDISNKTHPSQLCWSMIYRKLKGNRGCTMITDYEFKDLVKKLKKENNNVSLDFANYTYNQQECVISGLTSENEYEGDKNSLLIKNRLLYKATRGNAFETHLQAYIMQNYDCQHLKELLFNNKNVDWIGNEVSCGVGMQRIDILSIQKYDNKTVIRIIELKDEPAYKEILTTQLPWYIEWVTSYIVPTIQDEVEIIPTIISKKASKHTNKYNKFLEELNRINSESNNENYTEVSNTELFEYVIDEQNTEIEFIKIH